MRSSLATMGLFFFMSAMMFLTTLRDASARLNHLSSHDQMLEKAAAAESLLLFPDDNEIRHLSSFYTEKQLNPEDGKRGVWRDGGVDARLKRDADMAATGDYSFQIRDNSISKSSMELPLPGVREKNCATIEVSFNFMMHGFEPGESFILEYATYTTDRSPKLERCQWIRAETWVYNPDNSDLGVWMAAINAQECPLHNIIFTYEEFVGERVLYKWDVVIDVAHVTEEDNFSIRFRGDASSNSDKIYFDNVDVQCQE
jgi:hypothetical protein